MSCLAWPRLWVASFDVAESDMVGMMGAVHM